MQHIFFFTFLFVTSSVFALLEVQIEGKNGWAGQLPTWRLSKNLKGWMRMFVDPKKPITGYHVYMWLMLLLLVHIPFLLTPWSFQKELYIISFYILFLSLEDFLWFIFNPHYGWENFNKDEVSWHTVWLFGLPLQYWIKFPIGIILYLKATGIM